MPHSLRAKLGGLRYKGILEDKDYKRLCKALDNENVLEQISDELISIQDAYEQAKDDIYQHVLNKETNTAKAQGMLNALEMIVERLDKVIWKG